MQRSILSFSIGKKQMMAVTGLGLCAFVLVHMVGHLLYFKGPEAYNGYSHALTSNHLIYVAEGGLLAIFLLHMSFAFLVTLENRRARPEPYAVSPSGKGGVDFAAKTMILSGLVIFVFAVLHLITFKYGPEYPAQIRGEEVRDLYRLMTEVFQKPLYVGWYIVAHLILAMHLSHGFWSSFQSLGLVGVGKEKALRCLSIVFGWTVALGFLTTPIYIFFFKR